MELGGGSGRGVDSVDHSWGLGSRERGFGMRANPGVG